MTTTSTGTGAGAGAGSSAGTGAGAGASSSTGGASGYALDSRHGTAVGHHTALGRLLNPYTFHRIEGLVELAGARVLDIGAGNGSVAGWLADEVGPGGQVVALDRDTSLIPQGIVEHPRLQVASHDLADPRWPTAAAAGGFDLVHARLVLHHLPDRHQILDRLITRLAAGGVLLVQDFAATGRQMVVYHPDPAKVQLWDRVQDHIAAVFDTAGADRGWATGLHRRFIDRGLCDVQTEVVSGYWTRDHPGMRLQQAVTAQLAPRLQTRGLTTTELQQFNDLTNDPRIIVHGHQLYSTSGRRAD